MTNKKAEAAMVFESFEVKYEDGSPVLYVNGKKVKNAGMVNLTIYNDGLDPPFSLSYSIEDFTGKSGTISTVTHYTIMAPSVENASATISQDIVPPIELRGRQGSAMRNVYRKLGSSKK